MPVMRNFRKVMERTRESYGLSTSGPGADAVHRVLRSVGAECLAGQGKGRCDAGVHRQVRVGTESGRGAGGGSIGCLGLHPLVGTPEADSRAGNSTPRENASGWLFQLLDNRLTPQCKQQKSINL